MTRWRLGTVGGVLFLVGFFSLLPEPHAAQPDAWPVHGNSFVLRDLSVFDGERLRERVDVSVRDGLIEAVGPRLPAPRGTPELAAAGHTLLPALLDAHTHDSAGSRADALRFGVGTQIDMFSAHEGLAAARAQRQAREQVEEADMWSAGTLVTAPGGHGTQYGLPIPTLASAAEADAFVAARIAEGSDFVKLVLESGRAWDEHWPTLDQETLAAAIAAAHARDKLAVVHAGSAEEAERALAAGADALAHLFGDREAGPALVALARERGVFVVPTLAVLESVAGRPSGLADDPRITPYLAPGQEESLRRPFPAAEGRAAYLERALASTRRLFEAGVPLLAGSDAPNPGTAHGASLHRELELLVAAGLPPAAALAAATSVPADRFGLADRGRVARGLRADLLLVRGDPLADITATRDIVAVWKNGFRVERPQAGEAPKGMAEPLTKGTLGTFAEGFDGWEATTDAIQGGSSTVELAVAGGALAIAAEVGPGAPWPWAGALRTLASRPWEPVDLTGFETLELRLRGEAAVQVLFFSGVDARSIPAVRPVELAGEWLETRLPLAEVPGLDRSRVRAIAVVAGPTPGSYRFEIERVELR